MALEIREGKRYPMSQRVKAGIVKSRKAPRSREVEPLKDNLAIIGVPGGSIRRQVMWLALPVLVEQGMLYLVGFSDTLLTGRYLAVEDLAAVTVSSYILWFLGSVMMVASAGGTALVARLIGARDRDGARRMCQQAIQLGIAVGTGFLLVGVPSAPWIIRELGLDGPGAQAAVRYLRIVLLAAPLLAAEVVGVACLRGAGDTRTGMWLMALVNVINVSLSWALVGGLGPLPSFGLAGIAVGTAVGEGVGGLVLLGLLARGRAGLKLRRDGLRPHFGDLRRLLRISLPAAGESGTSSLCQLWFLTLINRLGDTATAAHGVAIRCEALAFLTIAAFSVPASTLTGQYLGAGRADLAGRSARTAWAQGVAVLTVLGLLLHVFARPMFRLFLGGHQSAVAEMGVPVLRLVAFAMPVFATMTVLSGALRGAGDTRWPWITVLVGYFAIRIPLTYHLTTPTALGGAGLGLYGAWIAMVADLSVRGSLITYRFLSGRWKTVRV